MEEKVLENEELNKVAGGTDLGAEIEFSVAVILDGAPVDVEPCCISNNMHAGMLRELVALSNDVSPVQVRVCMPDGSEIRYAGTIDENHITAGMQLTAYVSR